VNARVWKIAPLLFGSGFCALVYQTAWQRELRLIFGASTAASAAVLAIFMGGLGLGGALLGARVDRERRPLAFYANLEVLISLSAALTPLLVWLARTLYVALAAP
jgi:predicted membrane-bound spermidine synthase